jgi:hypothetical protein
VAAVAAAAETWPSARSTRMTIGLNERGGVKDPHAPSVQAERQAVDNHDRRSSRTYRSTTANVNSPWRNRACVVVRAISVRPLGVEAERRSVTGISGLTESVTVVTEIGTSLPSSATFRDR